MFYDCHDIFFSFICCVAFRKTLHFLQVFGVWRIGLEFIFAFLIDFWWYGTGLALDWMDWLKYKHGIIQRNVLCRCTYIAYYSWNKIIILHTQVNCIAIQHIHHIPHSLIDFCSAQSSCLSSRCSARTTVISLTRLKPDSTSDRYKLHKWSKVD